MRIATTRIYRLTDTGLLAVRAERSVPRWYRTILAMIEGDTPSERICELLGAHTRKQVLAWLDELQTLGFLAHVAPEALQVDVTMPRREAA